MQTFVVGRHRLSKSLFNLFCAWARWGGGGWWRGWWLWRLAMDDVDMMHGRLGALFEECLVDRFGSRNSLRLLLLLEADTGQLSL